MKSKPIYNPICLDTTARRHVFVADGQDAVITFHNIVRTAEQLETPTSNVRVLVAYSKSALTDALQTEEMGTAFYVAGPERYLWEVHRILRDAGVTETRIQLALAGSLARSVYCIHCGTIDEPVEETTHTCTRCGTVLAVRDHFSRYHGAYMGVRA